MKNLRWLNIFCTLIIFQALNILPAFPNDNNIITLKVALYPYVPNRLSLFQKIEYLFERDNPGVNLELVDNDDYLWEYYSGALLKTDADVFEIDTILLSDMIDADKIAAINLPKDIPFTKETIEAVTRVVEANTEPKIFGIPHWLCGNFLFYKKGDEKIKNATNWKELNLILSERKEALFVDFKGRSTLGEWYLTVLANQVGIDKAQEMVLKSDELDTSVVNGLTSILQNCPAGFCRNDEMHDKTGYYSRAFISGKSSAYIGYSESMHYGLQYRLDNCISTTGCLSVDDIKVRRLPLFQNGMENKYGLGWVDALAISSNVSDEKKNIARKFIHFMVSKDAYKKILIPEWGLAPRYLIPARTDLIIDKAPLYSQFYSSNSKRKTGTLLNLNNKLREIAKTLNCKLPTSRTDSSCK